MNDDIVDLDDKVNNAFGWLEEAITVASNLSTEDTGGSGPDGEPIYRDNGWKEMHEVCARLYRARGELLAALEPVKEAIAEERKRREDMPSPVDVHGFQYHPKA